MKNVYNEGENKIGKGESMARSEAQKRADMKYHKNRYDTITFISKREDRLSELLQYASHQNNTSKTQYILQSIYSQLARDGITIGMLPESTDVPQKATKQPKQYMVYMLTNEYVFPEDIEIDEDGNTSYWRQEEYVAVFGTLESARKYALNQLARKPKPENWHYTIFGKYYSAMTKAEAVKMYRDQIKEDFDSIFFEDAMAIIKPDYEEIVEYKGDDLDGR